MKEEKDLQTNYSFDTCNPVDLKKGVMVGPWRFELQTDRL
jgi:hypothetical protein